MPQALCSRKPTQSWSHQDNQSPHPVTSHCLPNSHGHCTWDSPSLIFSCLHSPCPTVPFKIALHLYLASLVCTVSYRLLFPPSLHALTTRTAIHLKDQHRDFLLQEAFMDFTWFFGSHPESPMLRVSLLFIDVSITSNLTLTMGHR